MNPSWNCQSQSRGLKPTATQLVASEPNMGQVRPCNLGFICMMRIPRACLGHSDLQELSILGPADALLNTCCLGDQRVGKPLGTTGI